MKPLEVEAEEEKPFFLGEKVDLHEVQSDIAKSSWTATLLVNETPLTFKLNSGADATVVPYDSLLKLDGQTKLQPTDKVL